MDGRHNYNDSQWFPNYLQLGNLGGWEFWWVGILELGILVVGDFGGWKSFGGISVDLQFVGNPRIGNFGGCFFAGCSALCSSLLMI